MHDAQAVIPIQRCSHNTQPLEIVEKVGFNAFQTGLCGAKVVCFDAEGQVFGLNKTVVATGKLVLQHLGILGADGVKFITAGWDGDAPGKGFLGCRQVDKGKLELHGAVKVIQKIAPRFKDCGLVLVLRELVVDVLVLDHLGVARVSHTADTVRPHTLIRDAVLCRFFFLIRPVRPCDGGLDLLFLGAGQFLFCGQFDTPPGLIGFAAPGRHRNCWSYRVAASVFGNTRDRYCG